MIGNTRTLRVRPYNLACLMGFVWVPAVLTACPSACEHGPAPFGAASAARTASAPSASPAAASVGPFLGMTAASIDRLDGEALCSTGCRVGFECAALRKQVAAATLARRIERCRIDCPVFREHPTPESSGQRALRECLKTLDCPAYEECWSDIKPSQAKPAPSNAPARVNPFRDLTPERVDALDRDGLCRVTLECLAQTSPESYPRAAKMAENCSQACLGAKDMKVTPQQIMGSRKCLKTLDCDAFNECTSAPDELPRPPASAQPRPQGRRGP
jgi:hypothetical protein